jgi:intracellular septation protein A
VYFKLFGLAILTFVFVALQLLWLYSRASAPPEPSVPTADSPR